MGVVRICVFLACQVLISKFGEWTSQFGVGQMEANDFGHWGLHVGLGQNEYPLILVANKC